MISSDLSSCGKGRRGHYENLEKSKTICQSLHPEGQVLFNEEPEALSPKKVCLVLANLVKGPDL